MFIFVSSFPGFWTLFVLLVLIVQTRSGTDADKPRPTALTVHQKSDASGRRDLVLFRFENLVLVRCEIGPSWRLALYVVLLRWGPGSWRSTLYASLLQCIFWG
ncbi:uncharacterized protein BDZ99DRAFT_131494 [Mytilinidion resinicola]|uniref:Secreted protein n=1 Tax=Mytilinidion resinicola TaxID=574789 RepID=A0A6A6Z7J1_9PEZI|nr:uncharacterized protein BDZ99DRAFT_131494 [Mytilinidion resinicola]KAF2816225.1 hypothetical protein BDZ99DRAFT_131494 [Mytilinidion resinicola]